MKHRRSVVSLIVAVFLIASVLPVNAVPQAKNRRVELVKQ